MSKIDFTKLSPEEKQALREQLEAEEKARKEATVKLREDYQAIKEQQVNETFDKLTKLSTDMEVEKVDIFNQFGSLIAMKKEIYNLTDDQLELQQSHTFTTDDGNRSIILGSNVIDRWTDDVNIGINGVKSWIEKGIADERSKGLIRAFLKPNKDGQLKASRVLEMAQEAAKIGDKELIEHIDFIRDQYRPMKTSTYVKAKYKDSNNQWQWLALSMSQV